MNPENLIPNSQRTPSERKELARKAGIASGKSRSYFKKFQELMQEHLDEEIETKQGKMPKVDALIQNIIKKAAKGDTRAFQLIVDVIKHGEPRVSSDGGNGDSDNHIENINICVSYNQKEHLELQERVKKQNEQDGTER